MHPKSPPSVYPRGPWPNFTWTILLLLLEAILEPQPSPTTSEPLLQASKILSVHCCAVETRKVLPTSGKSSPLLRLLGRSLECSNAPLLAEKARTGLQSKGGEERGGGRNALDWTGWDRAVGREGRNERARKERERNILSSRKHPSLRVYWHYPCM